MSKFSAIIWGLITLFLTTSCGTNSSQNDYEQKKINEDAYKSRFGRESFPEELSGIKISEQASESRDNKGGTKPNWKMILMSGDDSISAFDNARKKLFQLFTEYGIDETIQLSRSSKQQVNGVRPTTVPNLERAAHDLNIQDGDGCLIHMTSHGSKTGFYIKGQNPLTPDKLNQIVKDTCGTRPTVLLISACYSGIFAEPSMEAPNRIILAAARKDRTSFGCSAEAEYTYWDACLINNLPLSQTWLELSQKVEKCIEAKEAKGNFKRSYPQARFGADVKNLEIRQ